jgi:hypothetical protein
VSLDGVVVVGEPGMFFSLFFGSNMSVSATLFYQLCNPSQSCSFQPLTGQSGAIRDGSALDRDKFRLNV